MVYHKKSEYDTAVGDATGDSSYPLLLRLSLHSISLCH